jgi:death-on-curing family protein
LPKNNKELFALTSAYIELLHDEGIAISWPGIEPVSRYDCINLGLLESSSKQPFQSVFGADAYPTIYEKAACLFHSLIANHCFHNGNKRTGVLALDQFLCANGYVLTLPNDDMRRLAEITASYRQRGVGPKEIMELVGKFVQTSSVAFSILKTTQPKFHARCLEWRREIREHPSNAENAIPVQAKIRLGL